MENNDSTYNFDKKTKIICTIGPSSLLSDVLSKMHQAGMNCARINTAYGTFDQYKLIIDNVRNIAEIPIILDIKGPEIRLQVKNKRTLRENEVIEVGFDNEEISFNRDFYDDMELEDIIYIDNGQIKTKIVRKNDGLLSLLIINGGIIDDGKGVNIPNKKLSVSTLSNRDLKIIDFAKDYEIEYIALSFTRNADDIKNVKACGIEGAVIAKIENLEGVQNFDEILDNSECIMVARGGLGVEIEPEKVPTVQKSIIKKCNQSGKIVITATDMLESMIDNRNPTRAEVSDIANAILDGTDSIMLSGETSIGKHPVESVSMMSKISKEIEKNVSSSVVNGKFFNISDAVSKAVQRISQNMSIDKIVTMTRSGYTARLIARFKIPQPIVAVTPDKTVKKQLGLVFGVYPIQIDYRTGKDPIITVANKLHSMNVIYDKETILFTAAFRTNQEHASNLIEIHKIEELMLFTNNENI